MSLWYFHAISVISDDLVVILLVSGSCMAWIMSLSFQGLRLVDFRPVFVYFLSFIKPACLRLRCFVLVYFLFEVLVLLL